MPLSPTFDPQSLTSKQLIDLACTLARVGSLICDIGNVPASGMSEEPPYIWDQEE